MSSSSSADQKQQQQQQQQIHSLRSSNNNTISESEESQDIDKKLRKEATALVDKKKRAETVSPALRAYNFSLVVDDLTFPKRNPFSFQQQKAISSNNNNNNTISNYPNENGITQEKIISSNRKAADYYNIVASETLDPEAREEIQLISKFYSNQANTLEHLHHQQKNPFFSVQLNINIQQSSSKNNNNSLRSQLKMQNQQQQQTQQQNQSPVQKLTVPPANSSSSMSSPGLSPNIIQSIKSEMSQLFIQPWRECYKDTESVIRASNSSSSDFQTEGSILQINQLFMKAFNQTDHNLEMLLQMTISSSTSSSAASFSSSASFGAVASASTFRHQQQQEDDHDESLNLEQRYNAISNSLLNSQLSRLQKRVAELERALGEEKAAHQEAESNLNECREYKEKYDRLIHRIKKHQKGSSGTPPPSSQGTTSQNQQPTD